MIASGAVNDRLDWPNNGFSDLEWWKLLHWCIEEQERQRKREAPCVLL